MEKPTTDSVPIVNRPKFIIKFQMKKQKLSSDNLKPKKKLIVKIPIKKKQPKIIIKLGNKNPPSIKPKIIFKLGKKPSKDQHGPDECNDDEDTFENTHGSSWRRGRLLGAGSFGSVFLAHTNSPNARQIAVKSSLMENSCSLQFEKEVLDDLAPCLNVVQCYGEEVTKSCESGKQIYNILLEYCCGGSLHDLIVDFKPNKGLIEWSVRLLTRDIVRGIAYIHEKGYIHCDIKPENILLSMFNDNELGCSYLVAKIADFGLALKMSINRFDDEYEVRGTELYNAPESFIDWPVDIWALGCVVLQMLTANRVWTSKRFDPQHLLTHSYDKLPSKFRRLPPLAIDFLSKCFIHSPYQRSSARSLLDHPFINFH